MSLYYYRVSAECWLFLYICLQTTTLLHYMNDLGILDGVNQQKGSVDSVPLVDILKKIQDMRELTILN